MFEREEFVILTKAQVRELLAEVEQVASEAFIEGTKVGRADAEEGAAQEAFDAGYEQGYNDGHADAADEYGDDYDDGYAEGYEAGHIEAELRAAEAAAFEEEPRIHSWVEGEQID